MLSTIEEDDMNNKSNTPTALNKMAEEKAPLVNFKANSSVVSISHKMSRSVHIQVTPVCATAVY